VLDASGAFVKAWGRSGTRTSQMDSPFGATIDPSGDVWVADSLNDRLQKFDCP
jgi:tripartite motif-containing protein 71